MVMLGPLNNLRSSSGAAATISGRDVGFAANYCVVVEVIDDATHESLREDHLFEVVLRSRIELGVVALLKQPNPASHGGEWLEKPE